MQELKKVRIDECKNCRIKVCDLKNAQIEEFQNAKKDLKMQDLKNARIELKKARFE